MIPAAPTVPSASRAAPARAPGGRRAIALASGAVVACAAATLGLGVELNRTRLALQADGVLEFNFVQQLDHDFDALAHALADRLRADPADAALVAATEAAWRTRFDVLWSAVVTIDPAWAGEVLDAPEGYASVAGMRRFVNGLDADLAAGPPELARLETARRDARALSGEVYEVGLAMYQAKGALRDRVSERLDRLSLALWFSGGGFALAGLALFVLLWRATRRAERLVDETREARDRLDAARVELTDTDLARRSQSRFLAQATHDLRQPLQALQYYLAALEAHVPGTRGRDILARIGRSTDAAHRLLTELLDISKLDAGVLEAHRAPTELSEVLGRLHDSMRPQAEARGLDLVVERTELVVDTDGLLLGRILGNLLSNALAYTREGRVTVGVERVAPAGPDGSGGPGEPGRVVVAVEDTGIGIPAHEREAIFDEYYRLDGPDRDPERGIGIGLAIVRRLARLLDIPVRVESEPGRGTRFELALPLADVDPDAPARGRAAPGDPDRAATGTTTGTTTGTGTGAGAGAGAATGTVRPGVGPEGLAGLVVLVVDDEPDVLAATATLLGQQGCRVLAAGDADEAIGRLVTTGLVPDLVLADHRLRDGRTGVEAIERVRDEVNREVPALVVTGDTAPARLREAAASGLPLLHKPVDAARLFEALRADVRAGATATAPAAVPSVGA